MRSTDTPTRRVAVVATLSVLAWLAPGQAQPEASFDAARAAAAQRLERTLEELGATRNRIAKEKIPLSRAVSALEDEVLALRRERARLLERHGELLILSCGLRQLVLRVE